ncbi:hypothetical protein HI914_02276 [Erysiphe necator]|nr:hypothetical protein HI914_02276 [Erysiphe necator]
MPVTSCSATSKESNIEGSELPEGFLGDTTTLPTLFDVITELERFNSQHTKSMEEISVIADKVSNIESALNSRIVKVEQAVERITKGCKGIDNALITNVYKGKEPATVKPENLMTDNNERDPFSFPGLQSI